MQQDRITECQQQVPSKTKRRKRVPIIITPPIGDAIPMVAGKAALPLPSNVLVPDASSGLGAAEVVSEGGLMQCRA